VRHYRILLVDDSEPWRIYLRSFLQERPELEVVGEATDGLEAVEKAQELQPDLVLLDIGMPRMNGIAAAKRVTNVAPKSKVLFVSIEGSADFIEAALSTGAHGYIHKEDVGSKLLPAIDDLFLKG
jgi:DNA-binding NarL/FixJ family response regulator